MEGAIEDQTGLPDVAHLVPEGQRCRPEQDLDAEPQEQYGHDAELSFTESAGHLFPDASLLRRSGILPPVTSRAAV